MTNINESTHIALDRGWGPTPSDIHRFLEEKDCLSSYNKLTTMDILSMVSLKETECIHDVKVFTGWTCPVSIPGLAKRNGMSRRKMYYCIKELEEKEVIEKRSPNNDALYQFRVMIYPPAIERFRENPNTDKIDMTTPVPDSDVRKSIAQEAQEEDDSVHVKHQDDAQDAPLQDLEDLQESPLSVSGKEGTLLGDTPTDGEGGEDLDSQKQEGLDITPNAYIEKVTDEIAEEKSMTKGQKRSESDQDLTEQFLIAANPLRRSVVVEGKDYEAVRKVEVAIDDALESVGVEMHPLDFFKRCMKEANHRHEEDESVEAPKGVAYFTETNWGKEVVKYCAKQIKSEVARENDVEKTKKLIADRTTRRFDSDHLLPSEFCERRQNRQMFQIGLVK